MRHLLPELTEPELVPELSFYVEINIRTAILTQSIETFGIIFELIDPVERCNTFSKEPIFIIVHYFLHCLGTTSDYIKNRIGYITVNFFKRTLQIIKICIS